MSDELNDPKADDRDRKRHRKQHGMVNDNKGLVIRLLTATRKRKDKENDERDRTVNRNPD